MYEFESAASGSVLQPQFAGTPGTVQDGPSMEELPCVVAVYPVGTTTPGLSAPVAHPLHPGGFVLWPSMSAPPFTDTLPPAVIAAFALIVGIRRRRNALTRFTAVRA